MTQYGNFVNFAYSASSTGLMITSFDFYKKVKYTIDNLKLR